MAASFTMRGNHDFQQGNCAKLLLLSALKKTALESTLVVRQNFSRGPTRTGGSGGVGVNTIIDSVQQEDPKRAIPVRVERASIKDRPKVDPNYAARL
jgi:hypothetical protein